MKWALLLAAFSLSWVDHGVEDQEVAATVAAARDLVSASDKAKLVLPLNDDQRMVWAFTPGRRPGISWSEMNDAQKKAGLALLQASLSDSGFAKAQAIRNLEPVLARMENNPGRDPEKYWFVIFGDPAENGFWSWRYEGHHLSLTFSYKDGKYASSTPQFLGSNPAKTADGTRILRLEEELGRAFLEKLTEPQRKSAVLSDRAPADIATSNLRRATMLEDKGVEYTALDKDQQKLLRELVDLYASTLKPAARAQRLERIKDWTKIKFAWMGSAEPGQGHYYRIQSATFVIEYDNTQNGANHIHTVWRDFEGDWGLDALAEHYRNSVHHQP